MDKYRYKKKNRKVKQVIWLAVILAVIFFGAKAYYHSLLSPVDPNGQEQAFVVQKGEGVSAIADGLEKNHLIKSALAFKAYLKLNNKVGVIVPGDFKVSPAMSVPEILSTLSRGPLDRWVTLLEGWRVEEMAGELNKDLGIKNKDFLQVAREGYMFPDTYLFNQKSTVQTISVEMENNFDQKYSTDLQNKVERLGLTPAQGVILASIVEREGRSDKVRQQVAGILLKRFNIGMVLDADATVQYALGYQISEGSWWKRSLTLDDLKINSPYNTYLNPGLPPGPICNPGLSSLMAVANADPNSPYLYYYTDSKGNFYPEKTIDEHDKDVAAHP